VVVVRRGALGNRLRSRTVRAARIAVVATPRAARAGSCSSVRCNLEVEGRSLFFRTWFSDIRPCTPSKFLAGRG
jgi:hypothetical protein